MNKTLKNIFSMELSVVTLLLFACTCAVATFIENDFGPIGAKSFIYSQTWFELIMLFLTLSIIFNIIWFKMYKRNKFFIFIIHFSIIFIFIGSILTRYFGFEAIMTIPEGSLQNKMYSSDEYIQIKIDDSKFDKKVLMTELSTTNFSYETSIHNEPIKIKFNRFIPNAIKKIVDDKNGKPIINILVSQMIGTETLNLEDKKIIDTKLLTFGLNKEINTKKPFIKFETKNNSIYFISNLKTTLYTEDLKKYKDIEPNTHIDVLIGQVYKVGQTQFMINQASLKGIVKIVSQTHHEKEKSNQLNAVILDITYKNKTQEVPLYGKGGQNQGIKNILNIEDTKIELQWGSKELSLPFSILLNDFKLERYPGSNSPSEYSSDIKIYDKTNDSSFEYKIYMNNTLDYKGYRFFQSSYKKDESATILSVNKDPGKTVTYLGYTLLFTGLILSLFVKNSRFKKLRRKIYTIDDIKKSYYLKNATLLLSVLFISFNTISLNASTLTKEQENILRIDKKHANQFGEMLIQDYQGRIKPLNSLAIEILHKLTRKNSLYDLNPNQFFLSMLIYPDIWQKIKFIRIKDKKLKKIIGLNENEKTLSFNDIYTKEGKYKLQEILEEANLKKPALRGNFEKDIIKVDESLNIAYTLFLGDFIKAFPLINDKNNKWLNANEAKIYETQESKEIINLMKAYYLELTKASKDDSWEKANILLKKINTYQINNANSKILPSELKIKAEILFNKYNIFDNLTFIYLLSGLILLILVFLQIFNQKINLNKFTKIFLFILSISFFAHTFGLGLRWYISGHAPWSNGYESMIYISWAIILSGLFFSKSSNMALATTTILSGLTLFVAHLSWMEPQITTLTPVLKSYWLTIHVSVITASYGFLGLSCLLGFICLILFILANPKNENDRFFNILLNIKETNKINEMSILVGLVLLIIGNFLGGIWANESWGRYWGWDPKETWTLVSILIYAAIIHLKYIKNLLNDYIFASLSVLSYSSIIMTYFGVNYYLSGKHSYAAGDPVPIPTFVPITVIIIFIIIILAYRNRKVI